MANGVATLASNDGNARGLITLELPLSCDTQPQEDPERIVTTVMATIVSTATHSPASTNASGYRRPSHLAAMKRISIHTTKGMAIIAVAFNATATPISATPTTYLRRSANSRPAHTNPTISDSLCMPPIRCRYITGLATPSHIAKAGLPPRSRAIAGTDHMINAKPAMDTSLYSTTPNVTLSPTMVVITLPMPKCSGPYGVVVLRQSWLTSSIIGPGLTDTPSE